MPVERLSRIGETAPSISITNVQTPPNELIVDWEVDATGLSDLIVEINVTNEIATRREEFSRNLTGSDPAIQTGQASFNFNLNAGETEEVQVTALHPEPGQTTQDQQFVTISGPTGNGGGGGFDPSAVSIQDCVRLEPSTIEPGEPFSAIITASNFNFDTAAILFVDVLGDGQLIEQDNVFLNPGALGVQFEFTVDDTPITSDTNIEVEKNRAETPF